MSTSGQLALSVPVIAFEKLDWGSDTIIAILSLWKGCQYEHVYLIQYKGLY